MSSQHTLFRIQEEFEDTKGVIKIRPYCSQVKKSYSVYKLCYNHIVRSFIPDPNSIMLILVELMTITVSFLYRTRQLALFCIQTLLQSFDQSGNFIPDPNYKQLLKMGSLRKQVFSVSKLNQYIFLHFLRQIAPGLLAITMINMINIINMYKL